MKNIKLILMGMLAILLIFGMGLTGCSSDSDDSGADGGYAGEEARHQEELELYGYTIIEREVQVAQPGEWFHYVGTTAPGTPTAGWLTLAHDGLSASIWFDTGVPTNTTAQGIADYINNNLALIPESTGLRPALRASVSGSNASGSAIQYLMISTEEATDVPFTISSDSVTLLGLLFNTGITASTDYTDYGAPVNSNDFGAEYNPYGVSLTTPGASDSGGATPGAYYAYTAAREPQAQIYDFTVRAYPNSTFGTRLDVDGLDLFDPDGSGIPIPSGFSKEHVAAALSDLYNQWAKREGDAGSLSGRVLASVKGAVPTGFVTTVENWSDTDLPWPSIDGYEGFDSFGYHIYAGHTQEGTSAQEYGSLQESTNGYDLTATALRGARLSIEHGGVTDTILFPQVAAQVGDSLADSGTAALSKIAATVVNTGVTIDGPEPKNITDTSNVKVFHFSTINPENGLTTGDDITVVFNDQDWNTDVEDRRASVDGGIDDIWTVFIFGGNAGYGAADNRYHHTIDSKVVVLSPSIPVEGDKAVDIEADAGNGDVGVIDSVATGPSIAKSVADHTALNSVLTGYDNSGTKGSAGTGVPVLGSGGFLVVSAGLTTTGGAPLANTTDDAGTFGFGNQFSYIKTKGDPTIEPEFEIRNPSDPNS
ncbi:hypothetical protein FACS1894137_16460 [Spirochaetia bacterium]|nr:hypothetical protein FACS1894137_16460 [Spirochaetia bacterium]